MKAGMHALMLGLVVGLSLGLLSVVAQVAAAQTDINAENCGAAFLC